MQDVIIQKNAVNIGALDADLRASLGANVSGVSTGSYGVCVHLVDGVTPTQITQVRSIVQAHDATKLTASQQAELDRQAKLAQARQDYGAVAVDLTTYGSQPALIQKLAQKIAWLEQEISDLRKGG